jgi:hypothetical protein
MKITPQLRFELQRALLPVLHEINRNKALRLVPDERSPERFRWDVFHASGFPVKRLYAAGLNDDHIDTALRSILG